MMTILLYVVGVVFAFGIVIFVHEFGHFIVAKKSGVKVDRFSFGLGPEMIGFQWGETRYCIAWLPLGGEVRMAGEFPEEGDKATAEPAKTVENKDKSREFFSQPWYRRVAIALAGPFMNYVLAAFIFFAMLMVWGEQIQINKTEIGEVVPGMAAEKAGLRPGDTIYKVQGEPVDDFMSLSLKIRARPNQETELAFIREGKEMTAIVVPQPETDGSGRIGIKPANPVNERNKLAAFSAAKRAVVHCWDISAFTLYYLGQKIWAREKPDVAGPIGIGQVIIRAVKKGAEDFFSLIGLISVAIGLFNLFPIPMLDGGHVLYYLIEGIRGRPVSQRVMAKANAVGLALLLGLLVFATMNDIQRIKTTKNQPAPADAQKP